MHSDSEVTISMLKSAVGRFARARDWEQFHSPKNLSMSMAIEAAELMELFQWADTMDAEQILRKRRKAVEAELADVALYLLEFCNLYQIDLSHAVRTKLRDNAKRYPVRLAKGKSAKYTEYRIDG